jgi:hypothetical protein
MKQRLSWGVGLGLCAVFLASAVSGLPPALATPEQGLARTPILGFSAVPGEVFLEMHRDEIGTQISRGQNDVVLAKYTFTNHGGKKIKVDSPRFYAMADEAFSLPQNIGNPRLYDESRTLYREGLLVKNTLDFPGGFFVPAFGTLTIYVQADVLDTAKVQALELEPDFTSIDFIINYVDDNNNDLPLAPFNLTGNVPALQLGSGGLTEAYTASDPDYARYYAWVQGTLTSPYIPEGAVIRNRAGIDVYIVKYAGGKRFMRLVLSPSVFRSYRHLRWENVLVTNDVVMRSYAVSSYAFVAGDSTVWRLEPAGDTGIKRKFLPAAPAVWTDYDPDGVYEINAVDRNSYVTGTDITQ